MELRSWVISLSENLGAKEHWNSQISWGRHRFSFLQVIQYADWKRTQKAPMVAMYRAGNIPRNNWTCASKKKTFIIPNSMFPSSTSNLRHWLPDPTQTSYGVFFLGETTAHATEEAAPVGQGAIKISHDGDSWLYIDSMKSNWVELISCGCLLSFLLLAFLAATLWDGRRKGRHSALELWVGCHWKMVFLCHCINPTRFYDLQKGSVVAEDHISTFFYT